MERLRFTIPSGSCSMTKNLDYIWFERQTFVHEDAEKLHMLASLAMYTDASFEGCVFTEEIFEIILTFRAENYNIAHCRINGDEDNASGCLIRMYTVFGARPTTKIISVADERLNNEAVCEVAELVRKYVHLEGFHVNAYGINKTSISKICDIVREHPNIVYFGVKIYVPFMHLPNRPARTAHLVREVARIVETVPRYLYLTYRGVSDEHAVVIERALHRAVGMRVFTRINGQASIENNDEARSVLSMFYPPRRCTPARLAVLLDGNGDHSIAWRVMEMMRGNQVRDTTKSWEMVEEEED